MSGSKNAQSGFSMVELLIAVLILAIGLLGLAQLQITAIKANSQSETILAASSIAQGIIEDIAAMPDSDPMFTADVTDATWPGSHNSGTPGTFKVLGGGTYNVTYSVETNHAGVTKLCLIEVTVESESVLMNVLGNRKRKVEVSTIRRAV